MSESEIVLVKPGGELGVSKEDLIRAGVAENTFYAYEHALRRLDAWRSGRRVNDSLLSDYLLQLHNDGKAPSTIGQVIAAVRWVEKMQGITVVGRETSQTLKGVRRQGKGRGRGQVDGITWETVERICALAEADNNLAGLRDAALIRLMSDCLLRVSEAVAVDVEHFKDENLFIPYSKTDQEGKGEVLYVTESTRQAITRYLSQAKIENGAVFRRIRWYHHLGADRLTERGARNIIKERAAKAKVEGFISSHSLRVGSAMSLVRAGASMVDLQNAGRWQSSDMPHHYTKGDAAKKGAIARFKESKKRGE